MATRGEASNPLIGSNDARGRAGVVQALSDLRFELAVIGLLILTIVAIAFAGIILRNRFVLDSANAPRFTTEWRGDAVLHGRSLINADRRRPLIWSCDLRTGYQYPYCSYEIALDRHSGKGINLSRFQTIRVTLDYRGPGDSLRISLKNFDPRYSKGSDRQTMKFNQIELPLHQGRQTIEAPLGDFKVADWWLQWMRLPYRLTHTQFDNVAALEFDTGNNAPLGHHAFRIETIALQGNFVPFEQWYLGILGCWIVLICLYLIYRILGLQQDLRRRRLLEQVAQGEAQLARESARRDHLTGLFNRRGITERYQQMLAEQVDRPAAVMLIDIDHFKSINDRFGHVVGDEVLAAFAGLLRSHTRDSDLIARWGGEEFLLIARVGDAHAAVELANKLRLLVAGASFPHGQLTASFGVHFSERLPEKMRPAIGAADRALYAAKAAGRDRVVLYDPAGHDTTTAKSG